MVGSQQQDVQKRSELCHEKNSQHLCNPDAIVS